MSAVGKPPAGGMTVARLVEIERILRKPCKGCDHGPSDWWLKQTAEELIAALQVSWSESAALRDKVAVGGDLGLLRSCLSGAREYLAKAERSIDSKVPR